MEEIMLDVIIAETVKRDVLPIQSLNVYCNDRDIFTVYPHKCIGISLARDSDVNFEESIRYLAEITPITANRIVVSDGETLTGKLFGNITKSFQSETGLTLNDIQFESDISNLNIEVLPKKELTFYFDTTNFETSRVDSFTDSLIEYGIAKTIREIISDKEISYNCYIEDVGEFVLSIRKRKVGKFHLCYNRKMPTLIAKQVDTLSAMLPAAR